VVLCVDEKAQIQALDRTQPLLPMRPGQVERRTQITNATARPRCSRRSTSRPVTSSVSVSRTRLLDDSRAQNRQFQLKMRAARVDL
jgi:hypothetical protein